MADVALAVVAEVEVLADHHGAGGQALDEHLLHELAGRLLRSGLVEAEHDGGVQAGVGQQLELGRQVGQEPGAPTPAARPLAGCRSKVTTTLRAPGVGGQPADLSDHGRVAEVDAVEGADGDDGPLARPGGHG